MPFLEINRRTFLVGTGVLAALGATAGAVTVTSEELHQAAAQRPHLTGDGILVIVTMYGGNDGLNTLIPYSDNAYHDARGDLAYEPDKVLHLDETLGLNPAMTQLRDLWDDGSLAVIRGVGYPQPDHSHFRSMDIWQTASPGSAVPSGWIGRWLDSTGADPLRAVSIGPVLPMLAVGEKTTAAALNPSGRGLPGPVVARLAALGRHDPSDSESEQLVCGSYLSEQKAGREFASVRSARRGSDGEAGRAAGQQRKSAASGHGNALAAQLDAVSRCIKAGAPTQVYSVSVGGFDTHADERGTQEQLLGEVDSALGAFCKDMATDQRGRDVVTMVYSEFGRRVRANASQGTDHGTAGPVFVTGTPVKGGFYGDEPSLTALDNGDLKTTTDFRDIYAELLSVGLGSDPTHAVGGQRMPIGFL